MFSIILPIIIRLDSLVSSYKLNKMLSIIATHQFAGVSLKSCIYFTKYFQYQAIAVHSWTSPSPILQTKLCHRRTYLAYFYHAVQTG